MPVEDVCDRHVRRPPIGVDLYDDFLKLRAARAAMDQDTIE
jgi:hypothetical protein